MTLGERMEVERSWRDGVDVSDMRSGGDPTIYQMPTRRHASADDACCARVETWPRVVAPWLMAASLLASLLATC